MRCTQSGRESFPPLREPTKRTEIIFLFRLVVWVLILAVSCRFVATFSQGDSKQNRILSVLSVAVPIGTVLFFAQFRSYPDLASCGRRSHIIDGMVRTRFTVCRREAHFNAIFRITSRRGEIRFLPSCTHFLVLGHPINNGIFFKVTLRI